MSGLILDPFAGPGGWSEGLRSLGLSDIGIEMDAAACATRAAAGHRTIRADVASFPLAHLAGLVEGVIASPPCQDFSLAGKGAGIDGLRGRFVKEVPRWVEALMPRWVACEQVPPVLPIWKAYAHRFRELGYSTWAGILNAADYGVPQTRRRAFLLASLDVAVTPPEPTHCKGGSTGMFGTLAPWVSMAEALGWGLTGRPTFTFCGGNEGGPDLAGGSGARAALAKERAEGRWAVAAPTFCSECATYDERGEQPGPWHNPGCSMYGAEGRWLSPGIAGFEKAHRRRYGPREPSPTLVFGHDAASWVWERPSTAVCGDPRISPPGCPASPEDYADGNPTRSGDNAIRITVAEALALQGFRPDYPVQGTKTAQFRQVGDAVPPPLARAVLATLVG